MQGYLEKTVEGENLSQREAREATQKIFDDATDAQIGAFLTALRMKGETEEEIAGFAQGMKDAAHQISPQRSPLIDTCGTGGDEYNTINVSTASAVVASAAGSAVAKHGNYSVSSSSGSADVLQEFGVNIEAEPPEVKNAIDEVGVGFMLAPVFHPAMGRVIGPRKELGTRTVFNILGPLTNPANADAQVVGVYDPELVSLLAEVLSLMEVDRALVVHGSGLDEIALHDTTKVAEVRNGNIEEYTISPRDVGVEENPISLVSGGSPEKNARIMEDIFSGEERGAKRDIVVVNAGAALYVSGIAGSIREGVEIAEQILDEGSALDKIKELASTQ